MTKFTTSVGYTVLLISLTIAGCNSSDGSITEPISTASDVTEVVSQSDTGVVSGQSNVPEAIAGKKLTERFEPKSSSLDNIGKCASTSAPMYDSSGKENWYLTTGDNCIDGDLNGKITTFAQHQAGLHRVGPIGVAVNIDAQKLHRVDKVKLKYGLSGKGVSVGVWDKGAILRQHVEFGGRVKLGDYKTINSQKTHFVGSHGTHVGGTIGAGGSVKKAEGMANEADLVTYDWDSDLTELGDSKIQVSNHSYGSVGGWHLSDSYAGDCKQRWWWMGDNDNEEDYNYGKYNYQAYQLDKLLHEKRGDISVFRAAGNEGQGDADPSRFAARPVGDPTKFTGKHCVQLTGVNSAGEQLSYWAESSKSRHADTYDNTFDTIVGAALAKNIITVGALVDLGPNFKKSDIIPTGFSSRGPTDDGRIKPDIVANGAQLHSTYVPNSCKTGICLDGSLKDGDLKLYNSSSGTSMASPVGAGIATLLNELSLSERKKFLKAIEMKALLIHTAMSATENNSPNYSVGWGAIDALSAAEVLKGASNQKLETRTLKPSTNLVKIPLVWKTSARELQVTSAWLDKPFFYGNLTYQVDERTKNLVLDVDMSLVSPTGKKYYPWRLNPDLPNNPASNTCDANGVCNNTADNVERINISKSKYEAGAWSLIFDTGKLVGQASEIEVAIVTSN